MGYHTFDIEGADRLEQAHRRYRYLSSEELLWAVSVTAESVVVDLGSGTGFYTDDIAESAGEVIGIDIQAEMHTYYQDKGVPENVELVTAPIGDLPFPDEVLDRAMSTMTFHEFASQDALAEIRRVLSDSGRLVLVDWSATGSGDAGPPITERYDLGDATTMLEDAAFDIRHSAARPETFLIIAAPD